MASRFQAQIPEELRDIVGRYRKAFITVALLSAVLNVLVLGGSIYMMMVYDSVLPSHSLPTLFSLLLLLIGVYAFQAVFDDMRNRILGHVAGSFDNALTARVQRAITDGALRGVRAGGDGLTPMRDLESIRSFLAGPGPATLIDLPWIAFFIGILMLLHVWIGVTALIGGGILVALTFVTNRVTKAPMARLSVLSGYRNAQAESNLRHAEMLSAMGMRGRMLDRWQEVNRYYLAAQRSLSRSVGMLTGASKMGRMLLQSLILTVGALLVIDGKATGGVIFASSILSARALAPVDQAIANWRGFAAARLGWARLCEMLVRIPAEPAIQTILPKPQHDLQVSQLVIAPPGTQKVTAQGVDFRLEAGEGVAIIGPSGAGKSSLSRALVGIWQPARGSVRLDGATLDQWPGDLLGESIGYLPQTVELLDGTVAENISRFEPDAPSDAIIAAAKAAGVHDMIVALPQGYETPVGMDGTSLSLGQQQRVALARALYRDPFLVLLDEPNSNLDAEGDAALEGAIASVRARGGIVMVVAHRPSALSQVSHILFMRNGKMEAFGPRDEILARITARPVTIGKPAEARSDAETPSEPQVQSAPRRRRAVGES